MSTRWVEAEHCWILLPAAASAAVRPECRAKKEGVPRGCAEMRSRVVSTKGGVDSTIHRVLEHVRGDEGVHGVQSIGIEGRVPRQLPSILDHFQP